MDLFLVRHAPAEEVSADGTDGSRRLTTQGAERFGHVVRALERLEVRFDEVLHSPLTRCVQTAALLEPLAEGPLRPTETLARPPAVALLREIRGESVALVGHEPWMSETVSWLCGGRRDFAVRMGKGSVARLAGIPEPGAMRLIGLMTARTARQLVSRP